MLKKLEFIVNENTTIKEYIYKNISRNFYGYLKEHEVSYIVNDFYEKSYKEIFIGDKLVVIYKEEKSQEGILSELPIDIIYEDEYFLVIDKPAHLQSIPSKGNPNDSVFNRLLYYFKDTSNTVHLINRLDKETKGLILVAKNKYAAAILKEFKKVYIASSIKPLPNISGIIDLPIAKSTGSIKRHVDQSGQIAITLYELIDKNNSIYNYKIDLKTGRTHQIRVHFAYLNSPLINDTLYGGERYGDLTLGLVCKEIEFINPITLKLHKLSSKY